MLYKELRDRFKLFKNRNYLLFVVAGLTATISNGLIYITTTYFAFTSDGTISGVALLMLCTWGSNIVFSPIAGVCADRFNRKKILLLSSLGRSLAIFIYALCVFFKILDNIFLLGIFLGLFGSFFMPSAVPFITSIVDEKDLPRANATIDMIYELGIVIGMGLSGIFILKMGNLLTLVIGGIGFVLAGYFNYLMEYKQFNKKKTEVTSSAITDYIKAISYVKQEKKLLKVYLIQSFINVMIMTIPVLLLPFVVNILQADNSTFSVFELIHSLGIFIGYIFIPIIYDSLGFKKTAITFLSTIFLALASIYINPNTSLNVIAYFFVGFGLSIWGISISEAQKVTHVNLQGRVQSLFDGLSGIIVLILYLLITFYGNTLNIRTLFLVEAIVALSTIVISMICRGVVAQKN